MAKQENNSPFHPGEVLSEKFMKPLGLTQYRLAKELRVSPIRINQIIHGKRAITADTAVRLGCLFNTDPLYWLNLQNNHDLTAAMLEFYQSIYKNIKPLIPRAKKRKTKRPSAHIATQYDRPSKSTNKTPEFSEILQEGLDRFFVNFKLDKKIRK